MKLLTLVPAPVLLVFLGAFIAMSKLQVADRWPILTIPFALSLPVLVLLC